MNPHILCIFPKKMFPLYGGYGARTEQIIVVVIKDFLEDGRPSQQRGLCVSPISEASQLPRLIRRHCELNIYMHQH